MNVQFWRPSSQKQNDRIGLGGALRLPSGCEPMLLWHFFWEVSRPVLVSKLLVSVSISKLMVSVSRSTEIRI